MEAGQLALISLWAQIASRTSLNRDEIFNVFVDLGDAIVFFNQDGYGGKLESGAPTPVEPTTWGRVKALLHQ